MLNSLIPLEERLTGQLSEETRTNIEELFDNMVMTDENCSHTGMEHFLGIQQISDKCISDCVEAIIGTYLLVKSQDFVS